MASCTVKLSISAVLSQNVTNSLSNKRVGWNWTCRLKNQYKFGDFENSKLWMDLYCIWAQIIGKMTEISIFHSNWGQSLKINKYMSEKYAFLINHPQTPVVHELRRKSAMTLHYCVGPKQLCALAHLGFESGPS